MNEEKQDDCEIRTYGNHYIYLEGEYTLEELDSIIREAKKRQEKYEKMLKRDMKEALTMSCGKKKGKGK